MNFIGNCLNSLSRLFKKRNKILPCSRSGHCPYEYDQDSDRDVEGMPFIDGDSRSCPTYGHICPKFMEEFGFTVNDLNIRATIHCGLVMKGLIERGEMDPESEGHTRLMQAYEEITERFPIEQYPQYYF